MGAIFFPKYFLTSVGKGVKNDRKWQSCLQRMCSHLPLTLLHSEWPKLHRVLAILNAIVLTTKEDKASEHFSKCMVV